MTVLSKKYRNYKQLYKSLYFLYKKIVNNLRIIVNKNLLLI
jgi:hypothetical protein